MNTNKKSIKKILKNVRIEKFQTGTMVGVGGVADGSVMEYQCTVFLLFSVWPRGGNVFPLLRSLAGLINDIKLM